MRTDVRLDTSLELLLERAPAEPIARVLATVVATAGSTYRKAGARMLIMADGTYLGLLSGGCLEADLRLHPQQVIDSGVARAAPVVAWPRDRQMLRSHGFPASVDVCPMRRRIAARRARILLTTKQTGRDHCSV